ncbi:MAG: NADP-dependent oxidoreductase [Bacteroidales bacterium]|nr:NADP-dependent oxidoreductase [Bacteroidales bacterium]
MKAVRIHEYGSFEQLKLEEIPTPEINEDQVLVKVYATSVNHLDIKKASGGMVPKLPHALPWIPGHDFSGKVVKTGKNITSFQEEDEVYGNSNGGSYAEYLAADLDKIVKKPQSLSFEEAASVPHVGETAWQAIHTHGQLKAGQSVLIHGAAGAVGSFAVQFAREVGARIYATASAKDMDYVKSLGAEQVIDYKTEDFTQVFNEVDLVLALVGGDTEERSYSIMKEGGCLVSTVGIQHEDIAGKKNITAIPMVIRQSAEDLEKITQLINEGKVKTEIGAVLPLSEVAKGWKMLSGDPSVPAVSRGKIILKIE